MAAADRLTVVFKVGIGVFHCGNNNQNIFAREMRNQGHSITHGMSGHEEDTFIRYLEYIRFDVLVNFFVCLFLKIFQLPPVSVDLRVSRTSAI